MKGLGRKLASALLLSSLLAACSEEPAVVAPGADAVWRVRLTPSGETGDELHDVTAWRFENGVLQERLLPVGGSPETTLQFAPEVRRGTLYFLVNASGAEAVGTLQPGLTLESDFRALSAHADELTARGLLMTGQVALSAATADGQSVPLQRAVARIDFHTPEAGVEVRRVSVRGLRARGTIFPQEAVAAAADTARLDLVRDYGDAPLTNGRDCLGYVPEQHDAEGAWAEVEARLQGAWHRLRVQLPSALLRNHVYTVRVQSNGASLSATVLYDDWEAGGVSGTAPRPAALVDVAGSQLGAGVRVSPTLDTVFLPYTGGQWQLALQKRPDAAVSVEGHVSGLTVTAAGVSDRVHLSGEHRRPGTTDGMVWLNVDEGGVRTGKVTLIFEASPIRFDGLLALDDDGLCDLERYVDGELGTVEMPAGKVLQVETPPGEAWLKADLLPSSAAVRCYRILGGWRPNDPTADGRSQEARLVISDEDGAHRETYVVRRRNWGLPVVKMGETWWARYNLRGDVRSFPDQITCDEDPAAGRDVLGLLTTLPADSLLRLMGDQYQGGIFQGMPLRHDGEAYYHEGMKPSGQNFGLLDPTLMAPDGYRIPSYEDYAWLTANDNQNLGGTGTRTYRNRSGRELTVTVVERDVDFLGQHYGVVSFYEFADGDNRWVLFGLGHQWLNTPGKISRMHLLLATHGNADQTWVMEGYEAADRPGQNWIKFTPQNHIKTRTIRCVKTPVEYIY